MTTQDLEDADPKRLADVMDLGTRSDEESLWEPQDLAAILQHELSASIQSELARLDPRRVSGLVRECFAAAPDIRSFRDLFHHPRPPAQMLRLAKEFARAAKRHPDSPLPGRIATVLYVTSLAVARMRCDTRISGMDDASLRVGIAWAMQQPWVDEGTRGLLAEGLKVVGGGAPSE